MQRSVSEENSQPRPPQPSKSLIRLERASESPLTRSRANTVGGGTIPEILSQKISASPDAEDEAAKSDFFTTQDDGSEDGGEDVDSAALEALTSFEELPIEIRSMTERFLESLSAKIHPTPLTVDALSDLFQDFYARASSQIATHIAALSSRIARERTLPGDRPAPVPFKDLKSGSRPSSVRTTSTLSTLGTEQQMLTATEVADRRKARRLLELKRVALEEAVERVACERIYEKLWRHRSTDDEERDQKLRSRIAALSLVGIGLNELLVTSEDVTADLRETTSQNEELVREWLSDARESIARMDDAKNPLGKLQSLTAAHKSIVETLSRIFPASSSADEILPTLIYTIITTTPQDMNVISNLVFIQRFRANSRMDGEAAYCLVNLEAAISFLETVDLSSLRATELPGGPAKSSIGSTNPALKSQTTPMDLGLAQEPEPAAASVAPNDTKATPRPQRRLSNLIQSQTNKIEAASDAVRESIKTGADQALGSINSTLEESFKFLFGRLKEQQNNSNTIGPNENIIPKTLEDARKLVSTPPPEEDATSMSATSSIAEEAKDESRTRLQSKLSDIFADKRPVRDRSTDSAQSGGSSKRVAFVPERTPPGANPMGITNAQASSTTASVLASSAAVESVRSFGNSLNPLNRFANMNMLPRFGRSPAPSVPSTPPVSTATSTPMETGTSTKASVPVEKDEKAMKALSALEELKKTPPPLKRYMEMKDSKAIRIGDVHELLQEYQRLAAALRQALQNGL